MNHIEPEPEWRTHFLWLPKRIKGRVYWFRTVERLDTLMCIYWRLPAVNK